MDAVREPSYGLMDQAVRQDGHQEAPGGIRDTAGRFLKGVSGNPKGPTPKLALPGIVTKAEARALAAALYPEAWKQWQMAIDGGQSWAIQMAVQYELGKPTERHEVSGADGGPIEHVVRDTRQTIDAFIAEWREVPAVPADEGQ